MMTITSRVHMVKSLILDAEISSHRSLGSVQLLAVSKQHSVPEILEAYHAGCHHFGENYLQEALVKIIALSYLPIQWHFIGAIQRNKTKSIANHFSWVHTVESLLIAERLNEARPSNLPPLNICIQLNLDNEASKAGISIDEATALAAHISTLPRLVLRGLMIIPKPELDFDKQLESFLRVTRCLEEMNHRLGLSMDTLSMGMSHDFKAAICAGSTMVRIGTGIFGERG